MNYMTEANQIAVQLKRTTYDSLTEKQSRVLDFMKSFFAENDELPSSATIAKHFGYRSPNAAFEHVQALIRRGVLERNSIGNLRFTRHEKEAA